MQETFMAGMDGNAYIDPLEAPFTPSSINSIEDTGLPFLWIMDHVLKVLYFQGYMSGFEIADEIALPFTNVTEPVMSALKREKLVEVRTSQEGLGEGAYVYAISSAGIARAQEALERSQYAGPLPVTLEDYNDGCLKQQRERLRVNPETLGQAFSGLILSENAINKIGPAVNSGTSIFLYGPPGDGKTSVAFAIGNLATSQIMYIPYAIYVAGQVIKLYDSVNHQILDGQEKQEEDFAFRQGERPDPRWIRIRRPFVATGGELTLEGLDLVFDDVAKYYEAPFQVKANGGILLIDDFGRQLVQPKDLLNRWIVPLESRFDYLKLHTGRKIKIPFDVLIIFSTNLPPESLVDEAFLRRLRHKIEISDPTFEQYRTIFTRMAGKMGIKYSDQALAYLIQEWYIKKNRNLRASHPRDLCEQIIDISSYLKVEPEMTKELIDKAALGYFVDL